MPWLSVAHVAVGGRGGQEPRGPSPAPSDLLGPAFLSWEADRWAHTPGPPGPMCRAALRLLVPAGLCQAFLEPLELAGPATPWLAEVPERGRPWEQPSCSGWWETVCTGPVSLTPGVQRRWLLQRGGVPLRAASPSLCHLPLPNWGPPK